MFSADEAKEMSNRNLTTIGEVMSGIESRVKGAAQDGLTHIRFMFPYGTAGEVKEGAAAELRELGYAVELGISTIDVSWG